MTDASDFQVDLTNCDREPIHQLGAIQDIGFLLAVSPDWIITHASANLENFIGVACDNVVGVPLASLLPEKTIRMLRDGADELRTANSVHRMPNVELLDDGDRFDIAIHTSGQNLIIEGEPQQSAGSNRVAQIRAMADAVKKTSSIEEASAAAASELRGYLEFDRVMVYRFNDEGHGAVIAESRRPDLESYLGLNYPASDIPKQARDLYRRNLLRLIADVDATPASIQPRLNPNGQPLDLSLSLLRAVSPIHIEYLKNMGVRASMSISIIYRGELWGLFACHHMSPNTLPQDIRTGAELFGELFSGVLSQHEAELESQLWQKAQTIHNDIMRHFAGETSLADNLQDMSESFQEIIPHDGAACIVGGDIITTGAAPDQPELLKLRRFLNTAGASSVFATDRLSELFEPARAYTHDAAGILALPVSRKPRDYMILFRKELARTVDWAGDPTKPAQVGPNGPRLTPRKSFELWQEEVRGQSKPWTQLELEAAEAMRVTLLEVVLRLTETARTERERAQQQQNQLIAELNHRVRNILNLIKGLVSQSREQAVDVDSFTETVGARIQSLALAHDLITQQNWNPASLRNLITTEKAAYLDHDKDRVSVDGPDALIHPTAFTTLALVVHELITNSAKHGALSSGKGQVIITLKEVARGDLQMNWREQGGPGVSKPTRRGFGSAIIENSIPYDLGGEAKIEYAATGLDASFTVPAKYVHSYAAPDKSVQDKAAPANPTALSIEKALILEDNMIVAMEAENILYDLGAADVLVASNVKTALRHISSNEFSHAMLDYNLGDETAAQVALKLKELKVPFVYTTGYEKETIAEEASLDAPVVVKPYSADDIRHALGQLSKG